MILSLSNLTKLHILNGTYYQLFSMFFEVKKLAQSSNLKVFYPYQLFTIKITRASTFGSQIWFYDYINAFWGE